MTQQVHSWGNKNINLKKYMHPNGHSRIIYNCQGKEGT